MHPGEGLHFPWRDNLVLKLPENEVDKLLASKSGELFDPGHGRTSKTWIAVFPSAERQWTKLVKTARQFVNSWET